MKPTEYILAINQHPSFPCQLVEKSLWPEKPILQCNLGCIGEKDPTVDCNCNLEKREYERQKLSALQAGAVVTEESVKQLLDNPFIPPALKMFDFQSDLITGVYELDPSRWAVEVKYFEKQTPFQTPHDWVECSKGRYDALKILKVLCKKIAIISPVETPKEEPTRKLAMDELIEALEAFAFDAESTHSHAEYVKGLDFAATIAQSLRQKEIENLTGAHSHGVRFMTGNTGIPLNESKHWLTQTYKI